MKPIEKLAFLIDTSAHMDQTYPGTDVSLLEYSLRAVIATIWRRVLSNRNDLFTVFFIGASQSDNNHILKGVNHIRCMDFADQQLFHILNPTKISSNITVNCVDIFAGLEQANSHFQELDYNSKTSTIKYETIVLLSNFTNFPNGFDVSIKSADVMGLIQNLNNRNIEVVLTGMNVENIAQCDSPLKCLLNYNKTVTIPFNKTIEIIGSFKKRECQQIARYHGPLIFNNNFAIDVSCYSLVVEAELPKFTKFNTEISKFDMSPSNCGLTTTKKSIDSNGKPIHSSLIEKVFAFGSEKITLDENFESRLKNLSHHCSKGFDVIGFTSLENIEAPLFPGGSIMFVIPKDVSKNIRTKTNTKPNKNSIAFFNLLTRLNDRNMGIVASCRLRLHSAAHLSLMVPCIRESEKLCGFLMVRLPVFNDIKCNDLSLNQNYSQCEELNPIVIDQLKTLIESNSVSIDDITNQFNPQFQSFCNIIVKKYLGYDLTLPSNQNIKADPTHLKNPTLIRDIKRYFDL